MADTSFSDPLPDAVERLDENKALDSGTCLKNPMSEFGFADTLLNPCDPVIYADLGLCQPGFARRNESGDPSGDNRDIYINSEAIVSDFIKNS